MLSNSKSVTFLNCRLSQGSVATYCRWGENLCDEYIENLLMNHLVKEFKKLVHICQSYYQTSRGLVFFGTRCSIWATLARWLAHSTASIFKQLRPARQQAYYCAELTISSIVMAMTTASTYRSYSQKDGQAEFSESSSSFLACNSKIA